MANKILSLIFPICNVILPNKLKFYLADILGDNLHEVILEKNDGSMIPKERIEFMASLLEKCLQKKLDGNVIECGVYKGGSCRVLANKLKSCKSSKILFALDTFSGFKFDDEPKYYPSGRPPKVKGTHVVDFEELKNSFIEDGLDNVQFVGGLFEESFPKLSKEEFCFAHVDADLYVSTKQCIEFLKDRIILGGIIYFDDYNSEHWPGATAAINEMLGEENITKLHTYQAYWVKKFE